MKNKKTFEESINELKIELKNLFEIIIKDMYIDKLLKKLLSLIKKVRG